MGYDLKASPFRARPRETSTIRAMIFSGDFHFITSLLGSMPWSATMSLSCSTVSSASRSRRTASLSRASSTGSSTAGGRRCLPLCPVLSLQTVALVAGRRVALRPCSNPSASRRRFANSGLCSASSPTILASFCNAIRTFIVTPPGLPAPRVRDLRTRRPSPYIPISA
jgi:hypothetical protein